MALRSAGVDQGLFGCQGHRCHNVTASEGQVQVACSSCFGNPRFMACLLWVNVVSGICARVRHQLSRFNGYARVFATGERTNCIAAKQGCVCVCVCVRVGVHVCTCSA